MSYRNEKPHVKVGDRVIVWPYMQNQILEGKIIGRAGSDAYRGAYYACEITHEYKPYAPTNGKRERVKVRSYEAGYYSLEMQLLEE